MTKTSARVRCGAPSQQNIEDAAAELLLDGSIRAGDSLEAVIEDGKPRLKKVV